MMLEIPATIKGKLDYQLIHRDGRIVQAGMSENLILDQGMNWILAVLQIRNICRFIAVGTSSAAPAVGQTSLGNQIAETSETLDLGSSYQLTRTSNGNFSLTVFRAFDYAQANGNLTEFGAKNSLGMLMSRSLFKDGMGNPINITKTSDTRLLLTYTFFLSFSPVVETAVGTFDIPGLATVTASLAFCGTENTFGWGDCDLLAAYMDKTRAFNLYTTGAPNMSYANTTPGSGNYGGPTSYTAGSFYRDWSCEIPPTGADMTIYGYSIGEEQGTNQNSKACFKVKFASPIIKNKDYRLTLNLRFSLSR